MFLVCICITMLIKNNDHIIKRNFSCALKCKHLPPLQVGINLTFVYPRRYLFISRVVPVIIASTATNSRMACGSFKP